MYNNKKIVAIVPARAGSKRCIGKNRRLLQGKSLVAWALEAALASSFLDLIIVSTDDQELMASLKLYPDIFCMERPTDLATDTATTEDVLDYTISQLEVCFDYCLLLQPTSPLRLPQDIDDIVRACVDTGSMTGASFVALEKPTNSYVGVSAKSVTQLSMYDRLFQLNGALYFFDIKKFFITKRLIDKDTLIYTMPLERSLDIDTEDDFNAAHIFLENL